jgi:predicted nuclease of restriction endonuclease-like (RecB) superfamily
MSKSKKLKVQSHTSDPGYGILVSGITDLLDHARRSSARAINGILTATYWEVGRRIVEFEQDGKARAEYGEALLKRLAQDLTARCGRGFSKSNLFLMRSFYLSWQIFQTPSGIFEARAALAEPVGASGSEGAPAIALQPGSTEILALAPAFPLPWSHYVRLLSVENRNARQFYEAEALRGGWSVRQLDRQVSTQFYERTALSKRKAAMLEKGQMPQPEDALTPEEEIRDPYLLEFLNPKAEYSESDLEAAIIRHMESFLLELGDDFCFVGRQRRLRIDNVWYIVDLIFFHRVLRALLLLDLKLGAFTHADAGQMNLYLNYAQDHWVRAGENPPVGLILCAEKGHDVARYALGGLQNKVLASTYRTALPEESLIKAEIERTRRMLELRSAAAGEKPASGPQSSRQ